MNLKHYEDLVWTYVFNAKDHFVDGSRFLSRIAADVELEGKKSRNVLKKIRTLLKQIKFFPHVTFDTENPNFNNLFYTANKWLLDFKNLEEKIDELWFDYEKSKGYHGLYSLKEVSSQYWMAHRELGFLIKSLKAYKYQFKFKRRRSGKQRTLA